MVHGTHTSHQPTERQNQPALSHRDQQIGTALFAPHHQSEPYWARGNHENGQLSGHSVIQHKPQKTPDHAMHQPQQTNLNRPKSETNNELSQSPCVAASSGTIRNVKQACKKNCTREETMTKIKQRLNTRPKCQTTQKEPTKPISCDKRNLSPSVHIPAEGPATSAGSQQIHEYLQWHRRVPSLYFQATTCSNTNRRK